MRDVDALPTPLDRFPEPPDEGELGWLWRAQRDGLPVTPMIVVPTGVEIGFYRLNNLPQRLQALFAGVDLVDPDEDDLEELAPAAEALVRDHALLAEVIEALFAAFEALPAMLAVRPSGSPGVEAARGAPVLYALKRSWADAWRDDRLARRLLSGGALAPEPRPFVIHDALVHETDVAPAARAAGAARVWTDGAGRIARVELTAG